MASAVFAPSLTLALVANLNCLGLVISTDGLNDSDEANPVAFCSVLAADDEDDEDDEDDDAVLVLPLAL